MKCFNGFCKEGVVHAETVSEILAMMGLKVQKEAMHFNLLPDQLSYEIDGENVEQFEDHIWSLKIKHNESFLVTRILRGLSHFSIRRKHSDVHEIMTSQSEIDLQVVEEPILILTVRGYAPVVRVQQKNNGLEYMLYISARSIAEPLEALRQSNGNIFSGVNFRIKKESKERNAKYVLEGF